MAERETLEVDVLFVGAGPATLAGAYHLGNLIAQHNAANSSVAHWSRPRPGGSASTAKVATIAISGPNAAPKSQVSRARAPLEHFSHQYVGSSRVPLCGPSMTCAA